MQPIFPCQFAEDDGIHFNGLYIFATHQKTHVFKTLERIGQNVLLHILLSVATLLLDTVGLFRNHPMRLTVFIEVNEVIYHIRQGNSAIAVHILINCFEQDRLIGEAHIHRFNEFHELVCHILRCDEIPAILFGNVADAFLPEIVEHPLITKGNRKVRFDSYVLDVALHRLGLHINHPNELDLRDHILDAALPVEKVDDLIVRHIDWHIQPRLRLFP